MNIIKILILTFCLIHGYGISAYQVKGTSIEELYENSDLVLKVLITHGKMVKVESNKHIYDCGYDYKAEVHSSYKGTVSSISFRTNSQLYIGNKYLIFTNTEYLDAKLKFLTMGKNDQYGYEACSDGSTSFINELSGEIMEFDNLRKILTNEQKLKVKTTNRTLLNSLHANQVKFKTVAKEKYSSYFDISYWLVSWEKLENKLIDLKQKK